MVISSMRFLSVVLFMCCVGLSISQIPSTTTFISGLYQGCFIDKSTRGRTLKGSNYKIFWDDEKLNSNKQCIKFCHEKGYNYAATEYGVECFCGNEYGMFGKAPESACNYTCLRNSNKEKCGGFFASQVYQILVKTVKNVQLNFSSIGCYYDKKVEHNLDQIQYENNSMTNEMCSELCFKYNELYSATHQTECFCGDSEMKYNPASCSHLCPGNETQKCGGRFKLSVATNQPSVTCASPTYVGLVNADVKSSFPDSRILVTSKTTNLDLCQKSCSQRADCTMVIYNSIEKDCTEVNGYFISTDNFSKHITESSAIYQKVC